MVELRDAGLRVETEKSYVVHHREFEIGELILDLVVESQVIVELKACKALAKEHEAQLLSYLAGTELKVGLLLGFCEEASFKRKIHDNDRKKWRRGKSE